MVSGSVHSSAAEARAGGKREAINLFGNASPTCSSHLFVVYCVVAPVSERCPAPSPSRTYHEAFTNTWLIISISQPLNLSEVKYLALIKNKNLLN